MYDFKLLRRLPDKILYIVDNSDILRFTSTSFITFLISKHSTILHDFHCSSSSFIQILLISLWIREQNILSPIYLNYAEM
jgi:hypothetical protein